MLHRFDHFYQILAPKNNISIYGNFLNFLSPLYKIIDEKLMVMNLEKTDYEFARNINAHLRISFLLEEFSKKLQF